ncbi:hypothetical protein PR003_g29716 [Phytophthora rubi]|uniref:Uncharacterized protein n=1 Tax=Phytophthora rubi TaxID=129364 RepID=A0A6A3N8Z4_9STRA|nr:hypothetical protein PR002_g28591 [Phytophthora rubi]KAE9041973.1 hypothetical protein PR001_g6405 [Phytophthora rubi]KAE9274085.1 hypothetical protein PR003_g29716 [Phytophthora rubi]
MTSKLMTSAFTALRSAASSLQQHVAKGFRSSWYVMHVLSQLLSALSSHSPVPFVLQVLRSYRLQQCCLRQRRRCLRQ